MCRYALKKYKPHYVCFSCRKTFKQPHFEDLLIQDGYWDKYFHAFVHPHRSWNFNYKNKEEYIDNNPEVIQLIKENYIERKVKCPDCSRNMYNIGLDFKAPKKNKLNEWKIVESMYKLGNNFHTCGCNGPGYIPKNEPTYLEYLINIQSLYQENLKKRDFDSSEFNLEEYLTYWSSKYKMITSEIKVIKAGNKV